MPALQSLNVAGNNLGPAGAKVTPVPLLIFRLPQSPPCTADAESGFSPTPPSALHLRAAIHGTRRNYRLCCRQSRRATASSSSTSSASRWTSALRSCSRMGPVSRCLSALHTPWRSCDVAYIARTPLYRLQLFGSPPPLPSPSIGTDRFHLYLPYDVRLRWEGRWRGIKQYAKQADVANGLLL